MEMLWSCEKLYVDIWAKRDKSQDLRVVVSFENCQKIAAVSFISIKMVFQILRHIWLEIICNTSSINTVRKPQTSDGQQIGRLFTCYARKECALLLTLHLKPLPKEVEIMAKFHFLVFLWPVPGVQIVGTALGDVI